jgi:2-phosphoglycolate phosphatase
MSDFSLPESATFDPGRVQALVFDLDGTLVDSYAAITSSLNHACTHFGLPPLPAGSVRLMVGRGLEQLVADVLGEERVRTGVRLFREHYALVYAEGTLPLPEAFETVRSLHRRGYRMAVASNKPARFSEAILSAFDMLPYFDCVEGPDTAGVTKPEPTMIRRCLRAMGVTEQQALYVGDMVLDVETASRAGLRVVLVPGGSSPEEELRRTGERVLSSLGGLLELLQGADR